ncbi:ribosomal L7Ae/L30e/S12e/Gadd45 family protein|uniref:Large subunit ribosomal protein L7A n=1 Tax=Dendrosporobacter quercicolus TaxID=146817 RepID=A0A1G9V612_9FIRM|nr:ribosomal L7Ae/L30e/S12e/Gadd45 family protein [Dendrosporobacter quercicolus]NSL47916.1 ribosomal L7Ae/L30e/S12e/Gadd45 family protein [Dendrosporobacter quercicolus DSM 1736]SDM67520.1 large subunit ribosomal protein L7A [Dendrosporobacter quercicolus]
MPLEALKNAKKVIGVKQVTKAVSKGIADRVFVAVDADRRVIQPLVELCGRKAVAVQEVATMTELGQACLIEVGAAAAATVKPE